jgi:hypothetical protein
MKLMYTMLLPVAGHGGFSPYEVHIAFADGPSFAENFEGNFTHIKCDIIPTVPTFII